MTGAGRYPPELAVGVTSSRLAQVSPAARTVHRTILRAFAATGHAPGPAALADAPAGQMLDDLLAELHDRDVIRLDERGGIRVAYPFSGIPTAHTVAIGGGPSVYAMCAIDALGIAEMVGRNTTITSTDPVTGDQIK
jgi:Alkylmercury lyase